MLKFRSKSVDLHLDPEDNLLSNYRWKRNFLCGVYREEISSSISYAKHASWDRYVAKDEGSIRDISKGADNGDTSENRFERGRVRVDNWKMKRFSAVKKKAVMNVNTMKHEVTIVGDAHADGLNNNDNESKNTRTLGVKTSEKYSQGNTSEYAGKNTNMTMKTPRHNCQGKQFQRKYLKTKKYSGSLGDLTKHEDENKQSLKLSKTIQDPIICRAVAIKSCVPSPYDKQALPFKTGDQIAVTARNQSGIWRGWCNGREGNFKFIDVKTEEIFEKPSKLKITESKENFARSKSVSDLLSSISLENLTPVFVLNGYDTTEDIKDISEDDLEYLGISDQHVKNILLKTIDCLSVSMHVQEKSPGTDSGFNSPEESPTNETAILHKQSFLYPDVTFVSEDQNKNRVLNFFMAQL